MYQTYISCYMHQIIKYQLTHIPRHLNNKILLKVRVTL